MTKKLLFLTGTRADYGKLKTLLHAVEKSEKYECYIFATGMHTLSKYGYTVEEIVKEGFKNIHVYMNQIQGEPMDLILANTVGGLSRYVQECQPNMIIVHGDRVEAMAGAIVGALNNILVAHIEGGEHSGTIDGLIRHATSKMSHLHFVANDEASILLQQMGEDPQSIYAIGSPDIDVMLSNDLPTLEAVKQRYDIPFDHYGIVMFHPVTTEVHRLKEDAETLVDALIESGREYVVIYPNNDEGSGLIFQAYERLKGNERFKLYPSLRFEYFLTLLKYSDFIVGNSSAAIREAPVYGVYSIDLGTRQKQRFEYESILNTAIDKQRILDRIQLVSDLKRCQPCFTFGRGNSAALFMDALEEERLWDTPKQKEFKSLRS